MKNSPSIDLFCNCQFSPINEESTNKEQTLRQIWDGTPMGKAIGDMGYLNFIEHLNTITTLTFKDFAKQQIPELWDMTPTQAIACLNIWAKNKKKLDPNYFEVEKREWLKRYLS